jgi:hypothetical protein
VQPKKEVLFFKQFGNKISLQTSVHTKKVAIALFKKKTKLPAAKMEFAENKKSKKKFGSVFLQNAQVFFFNIN